MIVFTKLLPINEHGYTEADLGIESGGFLSSGKLNGIIDSGTKVPHTSKQPLGIFENNSIKIFQGPLRMKSYNSDISVNDCELLGEFEISRADDKTEVFFDIKIDGSIHVRASNKLTNQPLKITPGKGTKNFSNEKKVEKEETESSSVGTGFFVDDKGHIITNYHVVKNNSDKIMILYDHEEIETKLIAFDDVLDLALLKAKTNAKHYIKFSNKSPQKAQSILVAGFPYGKMISDDLKITSGIINSLKGIQNNTSMFQIDATINPGNSGGPIVDKSDGTLVGVATMKLSKDFTKKAFGVESENTNYGIKASQVKDFLEANDIKYKNSKNKLKINELESATVFVFSKSIKN